MSVIAELRRAETLLIGRETQELGEFLRHVFPDDPDFGHLTELAGVALNPGAEIPELSNEAMLFARNLAETRRRWFDREPGQSSPPPVSHRVAGFEFDFLGQRREIERWTAAQALNYLLLRQVPASKRAAVVGTMRDDGIFALEWIAHYQELGFDTLIVYTNDNADGSRHLLRRLADHGVILLIESETTGLVRPEVKAFDHAIHFVPELREHEWVLFVDSDELFMPAPGYAHAIGNVLDDVERRGAGNPVGAILYEWLWYNSGMIFERRPGLLMQRFQYATPHWLTKPLVRLRDVLSMRLQHVPELYNGRPIVNSVFEPADLSRIWNVHEPNYGGGSINHYWPKSFQEFSLKKARGDALPLEDDEYRRAFSLFFEWNAAETPETYRPVDPDFLHAVRRRREDLRSLDGIRALETQVEQRFESLLARYESSGGLDRIYRALWPPAAPDVPGSA